MRPPRAPSPATRAPAAVGRHDPRQLVRGSLGIARDRPAARMALEVRLATRPNGSSAWVREADVTVAATPYWISVDLATRHLALFRLGQQIMSAPAGVGTGEDPTPPGQYFVAFFEASPRPGYGPFILVTSAHSTAIANWEGSGDAVVGITDHSEPRASSARRGRTCHTDASASRSRIWSSFGTYPRGRRSASAPNGAAIERMYGWRSF